MTIQSTTSAAISTMLPLTTAVDRLSSQNMTLQSALSSGVLSDSYAGLGDQRYQALDLQPQITEISAWQGNITSTQNTLSVTQTAMSRITDIATALQSSLISLESDKSTANVTAAATTARASLTQLASLLNTRNGSLYVFGGSASSTAPVTNPQNITSSAFFSAISESVASLTTTGASGVEQETVSASASTDPGESVFSTALSVAPSAANALTRNVTVGNQDHVAVGFVATQGTTPTSVPSTTTGSSIRDLMRVLAVVGSLDQTDASSGEFSTLVSDTSKQMSSVSSSLTESVASIGQTQAQLTAQSTMLSSVTDALTKQLGSVKDSDAATLSTQISATQNQLTASYTLIADMKGMSLASYI